MNDEDFYHAAIQEFDSGNADESLLSKAWVNANGDESRKKLEYVKLRVVQLRIAKRKQTATAVASAAKTVAPSVLDFIFFLGKCAVFVFLAGISIALLSSFSGNHNMEATFGSVLAAILVLYLLSKLIEWGLIRRIIKNKTTLIVLSTIVSFLLIVALWYSAKNAPYATRPDLLLHFLWASILLVIGRIMLSTHKKHQP